MQNSKPTNCSQPKQAHSSQQQAKNKGHKISTTFQHFQSYCQLLPDILNQQAGYYCQYKRIIHPFLRQHDAEYLLIQYKSSAHLITINLLYSLPYQIPVLYFSVYHLEHSKHLTPEELSNNFTKVGTGSLLAPQNSETGVYVSQNPLTKQYMYTLHSCQLSMEIEYLIPFYLSLLELYPVITLPPSYVEKYSR